MEKLLGGLLLMASVMYCGFSNAIISQKRYPSETLQQALMRVKYSEHHTNDILIPNVTPLEKKGSITSLDFSSVPSVISYEELNHMFHIIRDSRFLYSKDNPDFSRRISWLYPDDGCFARAALSGIKISEEQLTRPAKIFVFGELVVQTPYAVSGSVYWWYHVAGLVRYMEAFYVLDPALNSQAPLLLDDWFHIMGSTATLEGVVCNAYVYNPFDDCYAATEHSERRAQRDQSVYLKKEWNRMTVLGFDPVTILGKAPPWTD